MEFAATCHEFGTEHLENIAYSSQGFIFRESIFRESNRNGITLALDLDLLCIGIQRQFFRYADRKGIPAFKNSSKQYNLLQK